MQGVSMHEAVKKALAFEPPAEQDLAVAALALQYASEIDSGEADLAKIGPPLLAALEALQMSPRARAIARKGGAQPNGAGTGKLDELRARRARKDGTASVDAASS